jgi:outer membrane receptor for ferrienterochelin and colicins
LLAEFRPYGFSERLRFQGAYTYHDQDSFYGTEHYDAQQNILFGQATWNHRIADRLNLLAGSTVRYEVYNDNTPATLWGADRRWIPGIFTQSELELGDLSILGGLRIDHHSEHGLVTAPRLSAKYSPGDFTVFRIAGGTGFRVVNVFTEDHAALTGSRNVVFTEDLNPERSRSITAGVEHTFRFGTNPLTLTADGFYTHFSNQILPDYDQDPNLIIYENLDGFSITRGFSVEAEQNFTSFPFSYSVGFTLLDVFTEESSVRQALAYAPDYLGNFGASYQIRRTAITLEYNGNLVGPKRMPDSYVEFGRDRWSPAFATHDLRISKEFSSVNAPGGVGFEVYASVENLFDFTQGSPLVDAGNPFGPDFDTIYTWGPVVGRTVSFGALLNLR